MKLELSQEEIADAVREYCASKLYDGPRDAVRRFDISFHAQRIESMLDSHCITADVAVVYTPAPEEKKDD